MWYSYSIFQRIYRRSAWNSWKCTHADQPETPNRAVVCLCWISQTSRGGTKGRWLFHHTIQLDLAFTMDRCLCSLNNERRYCGCMVHGWNCGEEIPMESSENAVTLPFQRFWANAIVKCSAKRLCQKALKKDICTVTLFAGKVLLWRGDTIRRFRVSSYFIKRFSACKLIPAAETISRAPFLLYNVCSCSSLIRYEVFAA